MTVPAAHTSFDLPLAHDELRWVLAGLLEAAFRRSGDLMSVKELDTGRYVHVNDAMAALLQRAPEQVLGCTDIEILGPTLASAFRAAEHTAQAHGSLLSSEHAFEWGGERHEFAVTRLITEADASGRRWLCAAWCDLAPQRQRDAQLHLALEQIEQQQRANDLLRRELADQALRDPASGLYRRAHFEDQLHREADLSTREHREFAVVFIELDPLSDAVVALGATGEQRVFESVGRLLRGGTRAMDASCRFDERRFAVLLSGVGLATAHARMEGLRRKCESQIVVHDGQELGFTVSVGVASFPHTAFSQDQLLTACEAALGEAQRRGGNHVTLAAIRFDPA